MRILFVRLSALGDIIHSLPAAARIKDRWPEAEITWLVEPSGRELLEGNPAVDRVMVVPRKDWMQRLLSPGFCSAVADVAGFVHGLRRQRFDAAVDLQGLFKSAVLAACSGARFRFGFRDAREGAPYLMTHTLDVGGYFSHERHVVEHNLRLADFAVDQIRGQSWAARQNLPPVSFPLPAPSVESVARVSALLDFQGVASDQIPTVALIPGTTWQSKIWPEESWIEMASLLAKQVGARFVIVGGPAERSSNRRLAGALGEASLDLTGKTSLSDLRVLLEKVDLIVGADTGPVHLAAAVGKAPVIAVFGSTPERRNGPYGPRCRTVSMNLPCQPCFQKVCPLGTLACLEQLDAATVAAVCLDTLASQCGTPGD